MDVLLWNPIITVDGDETAGEGFPLGSHVLPLPTSLAAIPKGSVEAKEE
jgi:hypothetical protein